jgi:hypothetical protein
MAEKLLGWNQSVQAIWSFDVRMGGIADEQLSAGFARKALRRGELKELISKSAEDLAYDVAHEMYRVERAAERL